MAKRGETREKLLNAAEKIFFANGFEATSVKRIIEEAGVVTGSFYHFFDSKEALFEAVVERFLKRYTEKVSAILLDDTIPLQRLLGLFLEQVRSAEQTYYQVLEGDRLHWTVEHALHNKTLEALLLPLSQMLEREIAQGRIESRLPVSPTTLAAILVRGSEAILHTDAEHGPESYGSDDAQEQIRAFLSAILILH